MIDNSLLIILWNQNKKLLFEDIQDMVKEVIESHTLEMKIAGNGK